MSTVVSKVVKRVDIFTDAVMRDQLNDKSTMIDRRISVLVKCCLDWYKFVTPIQTVVQIQ